MAESTSSGGGFVKAFIPGLIVGFIVGAGVGVVITATGGDISKLTESNAAYDGGNTRDGETQGSREFGESLRDQAEGAVESAEDAVQDGAEAVGDAVEDGAERLENAVDEAVEGLTGGDNNGGG